MYKKWPNSNDITWYEDQLGNILQSYKTIADTAESFAHTESRSMPCAYTSTNILATSYRTTLPLHAGEYHIEDDIKKAIFNGPATIVIWRDGTKTVVKCGDMDIYDPEKGLAMAVCKYVFGNDATFKRIFRKWLPEEGNEELAGTPIGELGSLIKKIFSPVNEDDEM